MGLIRIVGIVFILVAALFSQESVFALTISPARVELSADPGQSISDTIELYNDEPSERTYFISTQNFTADGETGAPSFIGNADDLATWIQTMERVTVQPQERKLIGYTIKVPKNAKPGGHFAAIFFSTSDANENSQMMIGGRVGALVLLSVSGEVKESAGINSFMTEGGSFFASIPIKFSYWFNNMGGNRIKPLGTIVIKNVFGFEVASFSANPKSGNVLPNSMRKFNSQWGSDRSEGVSDFIWEYKNFHLGYYTAVLNLTYGDGKQATSEYSFFVVPWHLVVVLPGIVLLVILARTALKRYNKWVIAQARHE